MRAGLLLVVALSSSCATTVSTEVEKVHETDYAPRPEGYPIVLAGNAGALVDVRTLKDAGLKVCGESPALVDAALLIDWEQGRYEAGPFRHLATVALSRPRAERDAGEGPFADAMRTTARELGGDLVAVHKVTRRGLRIERVKAEIYRLECAPPST
jgi:hypothetical protein